MGANNIQKRGYRIPLFQVDNIVILAIGHPGRQAKRLHNTNQCFGKITVACYQFQMIITSRFINRAAAQKSPSKISTAAASFSQQAAIFTGIEVSLAGKKVALFGSYGWGDGQWMRDWEERTKAAGAAFFKEGFIINETPDADGLASCNAFGKEFAAF